MSKSNASAKNRRAFGGNPPPIPSNSVPVNSSQSVNQQGQGQQSGFTLQQVIAVIDRRLLNLEVFMKDTKENNSKRVQFEQTPTQAQPVSQTTSPNVDDSVNEILNEYNSRFDMIVEELGSLKDIVLKLQSYTMDVNKTLLEERIRVFSDLGNDTTSLDNQIYDISNEPSNQEQENQSNANSVDLKNLVKEEFAQISE
jgi:hypothetical protein